MITISKIRFSIFIAILFTALSCSKNIENSIKLSLEGKYPKIIINSKFGNKISIVPDIQGKGSIGYMIDSTEYWIEGPPEIKESLQNKIVYKWKTENGDALVLRIANDSTDLLMELSFDGSNKLPQKWLINLKATENEYFTGVFERVVDGVQAASWSDSIKTGLNLRGEKMDVKLKPTVSAYAPFYISSEKYGFFVNGTWPGTFDFCKENKELVKIGWEGPKFSFKIYQANNLLEIVSRHARETGPSLVPPKWAFGPWRWRDRHFNKDQYYDKTQKKAPYNTDIVEDVLMMQAFDIPVSAFWIDRPWATGIDGFDDYEFDTLAFPKPDEMIKWLNSKNQEIMIWIGPFVMGKMADYAESHNYFLQSKVRKNLRQVLIDFSNPEAVKWWGENGPGKLAKMGVKGFKLDRADGEKETDSIHLTTSIGTTYRENYNGYPRQYVKATYDAIQPILGDNFVLFPRAQYTGSSKYGAMWAGDTNGKPQGLRSAIIGLQRCAVMGYPIWGSDVGGYWGNFSRETTMRWLGFGCFSPIMEVGPTNNLAFWSNPTEPNYDIELIATWRLYSKIRLKLMDYLREQALNASADGTPVALPLFLKYSEQKEAWDQWQTYLLGPDILVSPIWENETTEYQLYLPKGEKWIDAWDKEKIYEGGTTIKVEAPLYKIPVFVRKGSNLDLGNLKEIYSESLKIASKKPDLTELERKEGWK